MLRQSKLCPTNANVSDDLVGLGRCKYMTGAITCVQKYAITCIRKLAQITVHAQLG